MAGSGSHRGGEAAGRQPFRLHFSGFGDWGGPIRNGQLRQPLSPTTNLQMVAVDDMGAFESLAFEHPGKWENRTFSLAGDELSMQEIADAFSRVSAQDVKYVQVPWDQFEKTMGQEMTVR